MNIEYTGQDIKDWGLSSSSSVPLEHFASLINANAWLFSLISQDK